MGFHVAGGGTFKSPGSDTQAYSQFGNAIVVLPVRYIAKLMAPHIEGASA